MDPIDGAGGKDRYITQLGKLQENQGTNANSDNKVTNETQLNQEDFLSLLTKQLSQQDPFKPVENEQMVAQMASFATVNGISEMNSNFGSLNEAMASNQALQASSLVGQDVLIPSNSVFKTALGTVTGVADLPEAVQSLVVQVQNAQGELVRTFTQSAMNAGEQRIEWDGNDELGNTLPEGSYVLSASGYIDGENQAFNLATFANVNSVVLGNNDGSVLLNIAGIASPVKLSEVLEVGKAKQSDQT